MSTQTIFDPITNKELTISEIENLIDLHAGDNYTFKILLNSSYGSTSLASNPFSTGKSFASSITSTGRFYNRWVSYNVNMKLNEMLGFFYSEEEILMSPFTIQADTDSVYISLEKIVEKFAPKENTVEQNQLWVQDFYISTVEPIIKQSIEEVSYTINSFESNAMKMEQETNADTFISVAPKRYFLRNSFSKYMGKVVLKPVSESKIKITGLSVIGKSTPNWAKKHLKDIMQIILDKDMKEVSKHIDSIRNDIYNVERITDICISKGVNNVSYDYYIESEAKFKRTSENGTLGTVGGHGKGALFHNSLIKSKGLENKFDYINPGDKVKYLHIFADNPIVPSDTISFKDPKILIELGLMEYIDYEKMFEKIITNNVKIIFTAIDYQILNTVQNLEDQWLALLN